MSPKGDGSVPRPAQVQPPHNLKDRVLIWMTSLLQGAHVALVPDSPRLLRVLDSRLYTMAPTQQETDRTFLAEGRSIWTFEFQFRQSRTDVARMATYHLTLAQHYPRHTVHTVIYWGRRLPPARPLQVQQVSFVPQQVFLRALAAEDLLGQWREALARDGKLPPETALPLAMLPLLRRTAPLRPLLEEALPLAAGLAEGLREPARAAMLCLAYPELKQPADQEWARGVLLGMPVVGQELFEDLIREGMEKGELRQARQAVLDVFLVRFQSVPAEVRQVVEQAGRLDVLRAWLERTALATDASAAASAILGAE